MVDQFPGISGAPTDASAGGAELPLPPMSSFRAAAPVHSPSDPMIVAKPPMQPVRYLQPAGYMTFTTDYCIKLVMRAKNSV